MIRCSRARHRSMAAWLLMVVLTLAPSLALAAMACVPNCCPAVAIDALEADLEDCGAGFARQTCCSESPDPLASVAPPAAEVPSLHAILPGSPKLVNAAPWRPTRAAEAELALRTSPFRLSVVLLI
jgi:hypothetical protein